MWLFIGIVIGFMIGLTCALIKDKKTHICNGSIVMHGDELYLCLTAEDKEAFETASFATLRLEREKFNGFSET